MDEIDPDIFLDPDLRKHVNIYHDPWLVGEAYFCAIDGEAWPCRMKRALESRYTFEEYLDNELKEVNLYKKPKKKKKRKKNE